MPSDSTPDHRRTTKNHHVAVGAPPSEPEHLPCPRCDSTSTKFCYYNNYNFSQPRHFCKSCRRYWTHGGTLRDIPVGGGSRKNAKRSRVSAATSPVSEYRGRMIPSAAASVLMPFAGAPPCGSFTSLLSNTTSHHGSAGIFGFDQDLSFGIGRTMWPFSGIGDGGGVVSCQAAVGGGGGGTWQLESGEGGEGCFVLPDLAISTPGINAAMK